MERGTSINLEEKINYQNVVSFVVSEYLSTVAARQHQAWIIQVALVSFAAF